MNTKHKHELLTHQGMDSRRMQTKGQGRLSLLSTVLSMIDVHAMLAKYIIYA